MKKLISTAIIAASLSMPAAALAEWGHPFSGWNYYEIDIQPMTTNNPFGPQNIEAFNLLPFLPLPPPTKNTADPFMVNGYIILALSDEMAAGIFGAWTAGQLSTEDLANMAVGTMHSKCTDIGGAFAVDGNPYPSLLFKTTDDPNEEPGIVSQCVQVANFKGKQIVMTGLSNNAAFEGNWQSCYTEPPAPVTTELAVTGGTGPFKRARGELSIDAVKIEFPPGNCQRPGPVKRLKWHLMRW